MRITLERSATAIPGTYWHPVEHTLHQRQVIESVRRKTPDGQHDRTIQRVQDVKLTMLDLLLAGSKQPYTEARIEDPYKRGRFIEGFVYVRGLAAFLHEDVVSRYERRISQISPGVIISKAVEIDESAKINSYVELESGAHIMENVSVGANSVIRKGARLHVGSSVGAHSYVGQFTVAGPGFSMGPMGVIERQVKTGTNVAIGMQNRTGRNTQIADGAWIDDSVSYGTDCYVGPNTATGEMTTVGRNSHIGDNSCIGAESKLGEFVRVAKNLILVSPTVAESGTFIAESNFMRSLNK